VLWSKQYYYWDGDAWLEEHHAHPLHRGSREFRNREWFHMINADIISMPDKWEYPWYAAWDLAFHTLPLGMVDPDFAKQQLQLMLRIRYLRSAPLPTGGYLEQADGTAWMALFTQTTAMPSRSNVRPAQATS
jgi:hypothetical protein